MAVGGVKVANGRVYATPNPFIYRSVVPILSGSMQLTLGGRKKNSPLEMTILHYYANLLYRDLRLIT